MGSTRFLDPASIPLKRQSGGNIWATFIHITQGVTVIVLLSILMLFFLPVLQKENRLKEEHAKLQNEIAAAQDYQTQLKIETEHMKNDPVYLEHIARDKLTMGRPGETIIRFDRYEDASSHPKPSATTTQGNDSSN
jgi:cell division protein FtsB